MMAERSDSLAHTKWLCRYHIVFAPKYRRKVIYNQYRRSLGEILRQLCDHKGVEILEGHLMFDRHANLKYKFGNRHFWVTGYQVGTVGLNGAKVRKYIREQELKDIAQDRLSVKEYEDPLGKNK
jgi:putative transposase